MNIFNTIKNSLNDKDEQSKISSLEKEIDVEKAKLSSLEKDKELLEKRINKLTDKRDSIIRKNLIRCDYFSTIPAATAFDDLTNADSFTDTFNDDFLVKN